MTKTRKVYQLIAAAALCCIGLFTTCKNNIGLGSTIDINAPTIKSIYPPIGAVIRDNFTVAIEAEDDTKVKQVSVLIVNAETKEAKQFLLKEGRTDWRRELNGKADGQFVQNAEFLKDGTYTVKVQVQDESGKETEAESSFTVDNSPPLLILNRPSTAVATPDGNYTGGDVFGADFWLVGQVYDKTDVAALTINAKSVDGSTEASKTLQHIPQNIRMKVDTFLFDRTGKTKGLYNGLYGDDDRAGKKNFTYTLRIYDSAKEYKTPGNLTASNESVGNSTGDYYLSDDLYTEVLSQYKIHDVYAMLYGSYTGKTGQTRAAAEVDAEKVRKILYDNTIRLGGGTRKGTFALNPSINPRFDVPGTQPVTDASKFPKLYSGNFLAVKISRNLDDVPLESADAYHFFLVKWADYQNLSADYDINDENAATTGFLAVPAGTPEQEGGNYLFNMPIKENLIPALAYGERYVLMVRGKDKNGNPLIADRKGSEGHLYGFVFADNVKAPEVFVTDINGIHGSGSDGNITERVYIPKAGLFEADGVTPKPLTCKIKLNEAASAQVTYRLEGAAGGTVNETVTMMDGESFSIDASKFHSTGGSYKLIVKASAKGNDSVEQIYHLVYDVAGPEVRIAFPVGDINGNEGKPLQLQGSAFDSGSGLKTPVQVTLAKEDGVLTPVLLENDAENWKSQPIDLSDSANYGDGKYTLTVTAQDNIGQETTKTIPFIYDQAAPEITGLTVNDKPVASGDSIISLVSAVTVKGTINETYGLLELSVDGIGSLTPPSATGFIPFEISDTLDEGFHTITVRAKDKADKATEQKFSLIVDTANPVFKQIRIGDTEYTAPASAPASITAYLEAVILNGEVTDTGSGVKKVEYKKGAGSWTLLALTNPSVAGDPYIFEGFTKIATDTEEPVTLRITDNANRTTEWTRTIKVLSKDPELMLDFPSAGLNGNIPIRSGAFDVSMGCYLASADGTEQVTVTIVRRKSDNTDETVTLSNFFDAWVPIMVSNTRGTAAKTYITKRGLATGLYTVEVAAAGKTRQLQVIVDNEGPDITVLSPGADEPQGGEITIQGSITDTYASVKDAATKYIIGKKSPKPGAESADWQDMTVSTKVSWNFRADLNALSAAEQGDKVDASGNPSATGGYYKTPFYVLTEDELGNKAVREGFVLFNPNGQKPVVKVLSPTAAPLKTLGGIIQIFGTATAQIGGPSAVGEVYIQFSKSGSFDSTADGTFGGYTDNGTPVPSTDWYNGGDGVAIAGTASGGYEWAQTINADKSFNNPSGQNWPVYFRLRAKNKLVSSIMGEWSSPIKIIVDKSAPQIGSPDPITIDTISGPSAPKKYSPNMWLSEGKKLIGSLYDESGLKEVTISSDDWQGKKSYTLAEAKAEGWLTDAAGGNYTLNMPLSFDNLTEEAKREKRFTVKVAIVENTGHSLRSEQSFEFRFDNTPPVGYLGTYRYIGNGAFTAASITDETLAQKIKGIAPNGQYTHLGILAGSYRLTITGVSGSKVTFTAPADFAAGQYNYILYQQKTIIFNDNGHWIFKGVGNDDGSGIKEIKAKVTVNGVSTAERIITETDNVNKISKQLGGQVTWQAQLDLSTLADGKGTLEYEITDNSGNTYGIGSYDSSSSNPAIEVIVKNKPLEVSKITLKTSIGGEAVVTDVSGKPEKTDQSGALDAERNYKGTVVSKKFAFKSLSDSKIKVEYTGGEGAIQYRIKKGTQILRNLTAIPSDGEIDIGGLFGTGVNKIGNSDGTPTDIMLELWDHAHGFTLGSTTWHADVTITTLFDALDSKPPTVVILPFYWNGEGQDAKGNPLNSLYEGSRDNGHVEIAAISGTGYAKPSVSGKVSISGIAYDNIQLNTITATLPNTTALTVTATRSGRTWTSDKKMLKADGTVKDGAELTVESLGVDYLGHYVKWRLDWDTSKAKVSESKELTVTASDGINTSSDAETGLPTPVTVTRNTQRTAENGVFASKNPGQFVVLRKGETQYLTRLRNISGNEATLDDTAPVEADEAAVYDYAANKAKLQVAVVPYITEIETTNRIKSGLNKNTIRSSSGKYSVIKGTEADFITVKGFNLSGSLSVRLVKEADRANATATSGTELTAANASAERFTLKNDLGSSGYIEVFVDTIRAVNNINDNGKPYNKEVDLYLLKNKNFNDDRYLRVFDMKQTTVKNGYYPEMIMDGNDPVFGYIDLSGGPSEGAGAYKPSHAMPQRAKFNSTTGNTTDIEYLIKASIWDQMGMAKDDGGRYHHVTVYDRDKCAMSFIYDRYAELYPDAKGWGAGVQYSRYEAQGGNLSTRLKNNALTLETTDYDSLLLGRYQYPKIITKGNSITDKAVVYMAYYDANTNDKQLIFRNFQIGKKDSVTGIDTGASPTKFALYNDSSHPEYVQWTNLKENYTESAQDSPAAAPSPHYNTGRLKLVASASPYFDMGVLSDGRVVVVYFDESVGKLKLRYSNNPVTGDNPEAAVNWTDNSVEFPSYTGAYVSMDIDTYGGLHIAAFDSAESDLKYFYLPSYNSQNVTALTVDAAFSVGQWTQIKVHKNKPYIAYYNVSEAGQRSAVKLAVANGTVTSSSIGTVKEGVDKDGFVTGNWDCMTVPTVRPAQGNTVKFKKVNLGFDTQGRPVLGYLGDNIEFGKWLDE